MLLQVRRSGSWKTVARTGQDRAGRARFALTLTTAGSRTYRAVTVRARGAASSSTSPRTIRIRAEQTPEPDPVEDADTEDVARIDLATDSGDPIENPDDYVSGTFSLDDPSGSGGHTGRARFRVRGNSTSWVAKKPYKIKLDEKAALLGMPADKTWVLLANEYDKSLMRNALATEIARRVSSGYAPRMRFVEVYLNGEYRGLYQLSEQIQVDDDRVDISDTGFLLEADSWTSDDPSFTTTRGLQVNIKDPDPPSAQQQVDVAERIQEFEDTLYSPDFSDPDTGYASYIEVDAFIDWYLVNEITKNIDANFMNSCWMYLDRSSSGTFGPLSLGPVWDFDHSAGNRTDEHGWGVDSPTGWWIREPMSHPPSQMQGPEGHWLNRMFEDPTFVERVRSRWAEVYPRLTSLVDYIDDTEDFIAGPADRNYEVWPIGPEWANEGHVFWGSWPAEVMHLRSWMTDRVAWLDAAYSADAGTR